MMILLQQEDLSSKLNGISQNLLWLMPEIALVITLVFLLCYDLIFKNGKSMGLASITFAGLGFALLLSVMQWNDSPDSSLFSGLIKLDKLAVILKITCTAILAGSMLIATKALKDRDNFFESSEVNTLLFGVLIGSSFMVMSSNFC